MRTLILTAAAVIATLGLTPATASAQSHNAPSWQVPEQCQQRVNNSRLAGGIIGAGVGALAGRGVAGRGVRTEGTAIGAVVGAVAGSEIGRRRVACDDRAYNGAAVGGRPSSWQPSGGYYPSQNQYPSHQTAWGQPVYSAPATRQECGWGEASLRRPDGLYERQQVWMCRDNRGQWVPAN